MDLRSIGGGELGEIYRECPNPRVDLSGMLQVMHLLRQTPWNGIVYGLTSHAALVLTNEPRDGFRWVTIDPWGRPGYEVRYRLPESEAPWGGTQCGGIADTPERAVEMAVIGMRLCRAWESPKST